jgi:uroporphyrinogen III methyltransferase / synthase
VNGVRFFMQRLWAAGMDARECKGIRIASIGPKTAEALANFGLRADLIPAEYRAESILAGLAAKGPEGQRFLLPRAMVARDVLPDTLRQWGARVDVVPAYETVLPREKTADILASLKAGTIDCVTFTSSSTVSNFFQLFDRKELPGLLQGVCIAAIGPITAKTAASFGLKVDVMPSEYTIPALVDAILTHFQGDRSAGELLV